MQAYGRTQARCSEQLQLQARTIERLESEIVRLRAAVMVRETALAWARPDDWRADGQAVHPWSAATAQRIEALLDRLSEWTGERGRVSRQTRARQLQASLRAADLVLCQTGCVSHGNYWREADHCLRTGQACVLVGQPDALHAVRAQEPGSTGS